MNHFFINQRYTFYEKLYKSVFIYIHFFVGFILFTKIRKNF